MEFEVTVVSVLSSWQFDGALPQSWIRAALGILAPIASLLSPSPRLVLTAIAAEVDYEFDPRFDITNCTVVPRTAT